MHSAPIGPRPFRPSAGSSIKQIHYFNDFQAALYAIYYATTGCPGAAQEVARALADAGLPVAFDPVAFDSVRGLDHGAWVPLRFMFPDADVPVIPLSIQPRDGTVGTLQLGRALAPLRERRFLVIASGNVTHNLADYVRAARDGRGTPGYVREFAAVGAAGDDFAAERIHAGIDDYVLAMDAYAFTTQAGTAA